MRPLLHVTPRRGWLNDPNGLIYHGGRHHWFFQYNPHDTLHRTVHWGHVSSEDLLEWREHPIALSPGDTYDRDGCWSGAAAATVDGVVFLYTGVAGEHQVPCVALATHDTLEVLEKFSGNPVISAPPSVGTPVTAFRDHSLRRSPTGSWKQFVCGGLQVGGGVIFRYGSQDLYAWTYEGEYLTGSVSGIPGEIWECPDVFELGTTTVVIVSVLEGDNATVWWATGVERDGRFALKVHEPLDFGDRMYAPQSYWTEDGRRLLVGWVRTHLDAVAGSSWSGALSLPRELTVCDGRLSQTPARELLAARRARDFTARDAEDRVTIEFEPEPACEVVLAEAFACRAMSVTFTDQAGLQWSIDLARLVTGASGELRLFFDVGIVEAFIDGRVGTWSNLNLRAVSRIDVGCTVDAPLGDDVTVWGLL